MSMRYALVPDGSNTPYAYTTSHAQALDLAQANKTAGTPVTIMAEDAPCALCGEETMLLVDVDLQGELTYPPLHDGCRVDYWTERFTDR